MNHIATEVSAKGGERRHKWLRRITGAIGALAVGAGSFLTYDSVDTAQNEPYVGPKIQWVQEGNGHIAAQPCVGARAIVFTASSMGMDVSGYMGRNLVKTANEHGACVRAVQMGTYYTDDMPHQIATEIVSYVDAVNTPGQTMPVMFWGESWGSNFMQRVANDQAIKEAENIKNAGLIIESAPDGIDSVNPFFARPLLELSKNSFLGKRTLGALGVIGAIAQYGTKENMAEPLSKHIEVAGTNNDKTSPRLVRDQEKDVLKGYPEPRDKTDNTQPIYAFKWRNDLVVNNDIAIPVIRQKANGAFKEYEFDTQGADIVNHALGWRENYFVEYVEPVMDEIMDEALALAA